MQLADTNHQTLDLLVNYHHLAFTNTKLHPCLTLTIIKNSQATQLKF
jgi:hypothetical protein